MQMFDYNLKDFEEIMGLELGYFNTDNVVINIQIYTEMEKIGWDFDKAQPVLVSILHYDRVKVIVANKESDEEFKDVVIRVLKEYEFNENIYAFNIEMVKKVIKKQFNFDLDIKEIKPFMGKGWNRDRFFKALQVEKVIDNFKVHDPLQGNAQQIPLKWLQYQNDHDPQYLLDIVSHSMACLLIDSTILKNIKFFKDNYEIDSKGWLQ